MHKKAEQDTIQMFNAIVLLQALQTLEQYQEFCYNLYLLATYEEQIEGNERKQTVYIQLGGKTIGTHTVILDTDYVTTNSHYVEATYNNYFHTDALGSITSITNDVGTVVERRSYEPFGKIRAMNYGVNSNFIDNLTTQTSRAYTGHEQIEELSGLIHMNARVYDSDIGRFLSADTIIQDPHDSQSYNRYSYVRNNPLVFTDPSGHSWFSKLWNKIENNWREIVAVIVTVVIAVYAPYLLASYSGTFGTISATGAVTATASGVIATGALAGFASGAIMTGSLTGAVKGAAWGAVSAGVAFGIGHGGGIFKAVRNAGSVAKAVLHGLSRAAISKLQNGTGKGAFGAGLFSSLFGGISEGITNSTARVAASAIIGGTASELGGGKFSSGAMSGAFVMLFNDLVWDKAHDENIKKIGQTKIGRKMLSTLSKSNNEYSIVEPMFLKSWGGYSPKSRTIVLSSNVQLYVNTSGGKLLVNSDNVLAHELGHAYLHEIGSSYYRDEMYIINNIENRYGGYTRINHGGERKWW